MAHPELLKSPIRTCIAWRRVASVLCLSLPWWAWGCAASRSSEIASLRAEMEALQQKAEQLEQADEAREQALREQAEAREAELRKEIAEVRKELEQAQREAQVESAQGVGAEQAAVDGGVAAADGGTRAQAHPPAAKGHARTRRPKKDHNAAEAPDPMQNPAERVRALMADVASRLQVATETAEDGRGQAQLAQARRRLMEADRAASKKDFQRAEELAQDAAELIASVSSGAVSKSR